MIELEIAVTLAAMLTTLMLAILIIKINALRRTRLKHGFEVLDLAKKQNHDQSNFDDLIKVQFEKFSIEKNRAYAFSPLFLGQIFFGIAVFIGFAGWTYYLLQPEWFWWAAASAVFSLVGMLIPFIVWRGFKQRSEDIGRLLRGIEHYKKALTEHDRQQPLPEETVSSPAATLATSARFAKPAVLAEPQAIPEDSILKRHYLAQQQAEQEALTNPYPTDSVLRRHYDSMVASLLAVERSDVSEQPAPTKEIETSGVPEDSILRRHYLAQQQAEQEALTNPYPTDSVLRRHYDSMVASLLTVERSDVSEQPAPTKEIETTAVPEDSILRRHYLAQQQAEQEALTNPYPTDSVLRRHYDSMVASLLTVEGTDDCEQPASAKKAEPALQYETKILQDFKLKSRYIKKLRAEIEAGLFPRPTDSVLRRHYDSLVENEMENALPEWISEKNVSSESSRLN
ncbi:MAG: hypothetical protein ACU85E_07695 [Gammaproteobacteria bacterium]